MLGGGWQQAIRLLFLVTFQTVTVNCTAAIIPYQDRVNLDYRNR